MQVEVCRRSSDWGALSLMMKPTHMTLQPATNIDVKHGYEINTRLSEVVMLVNTGTTSFERASLVRRVPAPSFSLGGTDKSACSIRSILVSVDRAS